MIVDIYPDYQRLRATQYPPIGNQLDALWKLMDVLVTSGRIVDPDMESMLEQVKLVKSTYPKR